MGVSQQYRQKAEDLMEKIVKRPDIITRNDGGELVYMGQAVPNSNFNGLFVGMFTSGSVVKGAGSTELFQALRQLGVQSSEMTSGKFRDAYGRTPQPTRRHHPPTIDLDDEPDLGPRNSKMPARYRSSIGDLDESFRSPMTNPTVKLPPSVVKKASAKSIASKKQGGKGLSHPPGTRPTILYVY